MNKYLDTGISKHERCKRWMQDIIETEEKYPNIYRSDVVKDAEYILELLEKAEPKKPYKVGIVSFECPVCHKLLYYKGVACRCGQMIDWGDEV